MLSNGDNFHEKPDTVLCLEDSDFWTIVFSDLINLDKVIFTSPQMRWVGIKSELLRKMCRLHHSFRVNSIIELPFKGIWNKYDYVYKLDEDTVVRWIFTDTSVRGFSKASLEKLKKKGIRLYLLFLNPIVSGYETEYAMKLVRQGYFDLVYTVDGEDSKEFGFQFTKFVYSKRKIEVKDCRWKISYVGAAKNRLTELHNIAELFHETKSIFYIAGAPEKERKAMCNVVYNFNMNYKDVLRTVAMSDCLLEVVQKGQSGFTFRTYEALCYNKKLLTNNQDIKNQSFYDPKFIKVFSDIDSSLIDFVENDVQPDYHYIDQYSPLHFYEDIIAREKNDTVKQINHKIDFS